MMDQQAFEKLFGSPRKPNEPVTKRHKDIAASIQYMTEEIFFAMLNHLYDETKEKNLCMSGGVALNALANGKLYQKTKFTHIHVLGSASDSGTAIGAALYTSIQQCGILQTEISSVGFRDKWNLVPVHSATDPFFLQHIRAI